MYCFVKTVFKVLKKTPQLRKTQLEDTHSECLFVLFLFFSIAFFKCLLTSQNAVFLLNCGVWGHTKTCYGTLVSFWLNPLCFHPCNQRLWHACAHVCLGGAALGVPQWCLVMLQQQCDFIGVGHKQCAHCHVHRLILQ